MAILWQDKRDICMLTNIHDVPAEGSCSEGGKAIKPQIVMDYNHHIRHGDKGDRMVDSYSITNWTSKWTKNCSFIC